MDKVYRLKLLNMYYKKIDGKWHAWSSAEQIWFLSSMYENGHERDAFPFGTVDDYTILTEDEMDKR